MRFYLLIPVLLLQTALQACDAPDRQKVDPSSDQEESVPEDRGDSTESLALNSDAGECSLTLDYTIGTIDPRFGVSEVDVQSAMNSVVDLWSSAVDEFDINYSAQANLTLQLIYDERQERVDSEEQFIQQLSNSERRIDQLQIEYDRQVEEFDRKSEQYQQLADEIVERIERLNAWIDDANQSGGLGDSEVERLEAEQNEIHRMQDEESGMRGELTRLANSINGNLDRLNEMIDENNRLVDRYNDTFSGDHKFAGGSYAWLGESGTITVYQFRNRRELELVLAHELGHALGLGHVSNPESIMHETMVRQQLDGGLRLTEEDKTEIRSQCR